MPSITCGEITHIVVEQPFCRLAIALFHNLSNCYSRSTMVAVKPPWALKDQLFLIEKYGLFSSGIQYRRTQGLPHTLPSLSFTPGTGLQCMDKCCHITPGQFPLSSGTLSEIDQVPMYIFHVLLGLFQKRGPLNWLEECVVFLF